MRKQVCSRCRSHEAIPTHQLLKFDTSFHELCQSCWEGFRSWFFAGERIRHVAEPNPPAPSSSGADVA